MQFGFADLKQRQWKTPFSYGTVYGESMCSTTSGTYATPGTPVNTFERYCWCRATGFKPDGSDIVHISTSNLPWVFLFEYGIDTSIAGCRVTCPYRCAVEIQNARSSFRRVVYGQSGS